MDKARKALEQEVDIIKMIRSNRFMELALRHLLKPAVHKALKEKSNFAEVSSCLLEDIKQDESILVDITRLEN